MDQLKVSCVGVAWLWVMVAVRMSDELGGWSGKPIVMAPYIAQHSVGHSNNRWNDPPRWNVATNTSHSGRVTFIKLPSAAKLVDSSERAPTGVECWL